jgi:hypothetical protein
MQATGDITGENAARYGFESTESFELWRLRTQVSNLRKAANRGDCVNVNEVAEKVESWKNMGLLPVNYSYEEGDDRPGEMIFRFYRCWRAWVEGNSRSPTDNPKHWCTKLCPGFLAMKAVKIEEREDIPYGWSHWETDDNWETDDSDDDDDDEDSI